MTEPLDDARGELLALARSLRSRRIMRDGGNGNVYDIADDECERAADLIEGIARPAPWREAVESFIEHLRPVQQVFDRDGTVQASWAVDGRKWFTLDFTKALRILESAALVPPPSEAGREDEPEIDLLAKRLAGAELNYRNAYERNNDHINTGRMWDKMRRAGDAIRQYFHEREESPDPGTVAVASAERMCPDCGRSVDGPTHAAYCAISSTLRETGK